MFFVLRHWKLIGLLVAVGLAALALWARAAAKVTNSPDLDRTPLVNSTRAADTRSNKPHLATPDFVKGIYMSAAVAGNTTLRRNLIDLVTRTELNTLVIDVKDDTGHIAYRTAEVELQPHVADNVYIKNLPQLIDELHQKNIYLVARVVVFQDPAYVALFPAEAVQTNHGDPWRDYRGSTWVDPASEAAWRYNAALAGDAYAQGFDEIQFDYVRFPSDGDLAAIRYPLFAVEKNQRVDILKNFFAYLDNELRQRGIPISIDLFGFSYWWRDEDLTIGQRLRDAAPYFTTLSPMVYPSHYPRGTLDFVNPAEHPYEIISETLKRGREIMQEWPEVKFVTRPWLQDFKRGAVYTPAMLQEEMRAVRDGGGTGWMLWNARNVYTEAALQRE